MSAGKTRVTEIKVPIKVGQHLKIKAEGRWWSFCNAARKKLTTPAAYATIGRQYLKEGVFTNDLHPSNFRRNWNGGPTWIEEA